MGLDLMLQRLGSQVVVEGQVGLGLIGPYQAVPGQASLGLGRRGLGRGQVGLGGDPVGLGLIGPYLASRGVDRHREVRFLASLHLVGCQAEPDLIVLGPTGRFLASGGADQDPGVLRPGNRGLADRRAGRGRIGPCLISLCLIRLCLINLCLTSLCLVDLGPMVPSLVR